jgi:pyridoxal phosphate enzyme (YggS family)
MGPPGAGRGRGGPATPIDRDAVLGNLERIRTEIEAACRRAERDASTVRVVAAAKGVPVERVRWVVDAGIADVGENYVKELADKRPAVPGVRWHFIGNLQSHTAHRVAELADVVETLASERAARRLARRAAERRVELPALIEVDFTGERTGVRVEGLDSFAAFVDTLEGVSLVGLMTLPPLPERAEDSRPHFRRLRELAERLHRGHSGMAELSMGMSIDYEVAVEEGATMVRIGTALFGERRPST